jgi:hypothetical protein
MDIYTALEEGHIRLLRIEPASTPSSEVRYRLTVFPLSQSPEYIALSYTWGPPYPGYGAKDEEEQDNNNQPGEQEHQRMHETEISRYQATKQAFCNDKEMSITNNLLDFLVHCSEYGDEGLLGYIWIDAICINQVDLPERSHQVNLMAEIYKAASRVVVWLGVAEESTPLAFDLIDHLAMISPTESLTLSPYSLNLSNMDSWVALARFFERSWFNRAWIIQEVTFARQITVLCGGCTIAWEHLTNVSQFLALSTWTDFLKDSELLKSKGGAVRSHNTPARLAATKRTYLSAPKDSLLFALIRGRHSLCQDPRDKVYSQLSLGYADIFPSYKVTAAEAYVTTAKYILENTDNLFLLTCVEGEEFQKVHGLPSWVPDWSVIDNVGLGITGYRPFLAAGSLLRNYSLKTAQGRQILSVEATRLDKIAEAGETKPELRSFVKPGKLWSMISNLSERYHTGQSREEVIWRTLITNRGRDLVDASSAPAAPVLYPATKAFEPSFSAWILSRYCVASLNQHHTEPTDFPVNTSSAGILPSKNDILEAVTKAREGIAEGKDSFLSSLIQSASYFDTHYSRALLQRPFRTAQGLFGLGTQALRESDSIWIVPGCRVPLIFRAVSDSPRYRLVGGCYVHGFMDGEVLERNGIEFEMVELE